MAISRFAQAQDRLQPLHIVLAAALVALGAALRWFGADGELWLDEVWSLNTALSLNAWHEAFWADFSDNNHPLNTAWMHLMGAGRAPWVYRFEAMALGTLSIGAAGWTMARHGTSNAPARVLGAMTLLAVMYPFVHFGSEARGYAGMMLFAILAFAAAEDGASGDKSARWRFALWGAFGLASHLASMPVMAFLALGQALQTRANSRPTLRVLSVMVRFSAPYAFVLTGYILVWQVHFKTHGETLAFGGGTGDCSGRECFVDALGELVRLSIGGLGEGRAGLSAGLAAIVTIGAVAWLGAVGNRRAILYAMVLLAQPLLFLAFAQPALPYGRYFLGVFVFWPLLMADVMGELTGNGRAARALAGLMLLALISFNAWGLSQFYQLRRGDYAAALDILRKDHTDGTLSIGTNMPFQFLTVSEHAARIVQPGLTLEIVPRRAIAEAAPVWLVTVTVPPQFMALKYCEGAHLYERVSTHTYWGFSGSYWGVYKKSAAPAPTGGDCPSVPRAGTRFR